MQMAIASFAMTGTPLVIMNGTARAFSEWGSAGTLVNLTVAGSDLGNSQVNRTRCLWWQDLGLH
jgi:hypothetical protein